MCPMQNGRHTAFTSPLSKAFPNLHAPGAHLAAQQKVELVHIVAGGLALAPVYRDTIPYLVLDDQHPQVFQLFPQLFDIEADQAVVDIHVGPVVKDIQAAIAGAPAATAAARMILPVSTQHF